ncbi:MAG: heavy metal translocating P-type ATPase [Leeuwenhoekiella sp.]|uniref:heavy metal translocating P-type ATPase n=1 Tax=Leeuwenhoekiella TaxID=283735 RepID=UPI00235600AD|nr:heavy metal translocating P-type ATPase [Leeuwenhoekiella blandensis]|tara:strand:+ start:48553 stop:50514 length:1962 start_codon:yes stop_codon:yes gene_type:complete
MKEHKHPHTHIADDACCAKHSKAATAEHQHHHTLEFKTYAPGLFSFLMLASGMLLDHFEASFFKESFRLIWYVVAYIPVGIPVLKDSWESIKKGAVFTEFLLMSIATLGAFVLGEYPEGVTVMLFYAVGELFQHAAVDKAKSNIKALLDVRPNEALVYRNEKFTPVAPDAVEVGERVQVRKGEKIPLDGILLSAKASLNTAALTGESKPDTITKGEAVYAGSINVDEVIELQTTAVFKESAIARILELVQNATSRKSKTELFIRKFAKVYTPIVAFLALALTFLPYFFVADYVFKEWLYRALIFLVISCPCALVISIPLGYFGGLGAASRNGILFKGASFLDAMTKIKILVTDKTGTLTQGVFRIKTIEVHNGWDETRFMAYVKAIEAQSTHPIAKAIQEYEVEAGALEVKNVEEHSGQGLKATINGKTVLAGNAELLNNHNIEVPQSLDAVVETLVLVAIEDQFAGYIVVADALKADAKTAIQKLKEAGVQQTVMLSGDKDSITQQIAQSLGITWAKGGLLPEEKLREVEQLQAQGHTKVAFVGDGINDAPVLATADVGIAMGGLGSDVAIETADVIIQNDEPSKVAQAMQIGKSTRKIVWQNIALAFGVKAAVLILGAGGLATMWEAVFADVGVAFLAILNAIRLQNMKWE